MASLCPYWSAFAIYTAVSDDYPSNVLVRPEADTRNIQADGIKALVRPISVTNQLESEVESCIVRTRFERIRA